MSRILISCLLLAAVFCTGMFLGMHLQAGQQLAANQVGVELGQATYSKAIDQGASAVANVQASDSQITSTQTAVETELTQNVRRTPLVLAPSCPADHDAVHGWVDRNDLALRSQRPTPQQAGSSAGAEADPDLGLGQVDRPADLPISLGAVRLWNSALTGEFRDAALAADTCPADDPTAVACVAGAGLTVRDAWRNHNTNAAACARDRSQLAELIALLRTRESDLATLKARP